jgi:hypothetical protein
MEWQLSGKERYAPNDPRYLLKSRQTSCLATLG